jgi:hypothetical protein
VIVSREGLVVTTRTKRSAQERIIKSNSSTVLVLTPNGELARKGIPDNSLRLLIVA